MAEAGAGEKLKVFISYSRKSSDAFVDDLVVGLEDRGFAPILDRHDIEPGEPWEARLGGLIEQSDTVVFVVSPDAVKSERCDWEINKTLALSKRLLPVIHKSVPDGEIPPKLSELQFIHFDTAPGVMRPVRELADALRVDFHWIREHTRLGEIARRWDKRGRPEALLLRGDEIDAAKVWMAARNAAAPEITDVQRAFVTASEEADAARLEKERAQLDAIGRAQDATARQQRRAARLLWSVATLAFGMFGYVSWQSYQVARREINVVTARATEALNNEQFDRAIRYALQAYPARGHLPWITPFSTELEGKLAGGAQSTLLRQILRGHSREVRAATFSADSRRVVTASEDNTARIWDAESGQEIAILKGHKKTINSARFSGDGKRVVTASDDDTARIWSVANGQEIARLEGVTTIKDIAFSGDGKRVVAAAWDITTRIWDVESGKTLVVLDTDTLTHTAAFSADGKRVVTDTQIWDAESGRRIATLEGHTYSVNSAVFSRDGKLIVSASNDNTARIWNAENGKEIAVLKGHTGSVRSAVFSSDGKWVVTGSQDDTARIWDANTGQQIAVLQGHTSTVISATFSHDSARIVTASWDSTARIWDAQSGRMIAVLKGHADRVQSAAFSGDDKRVVSASSDGTARIWDMTGGRKILGPNGLVQSATFSRNGRLVVADSDHRASPPVSFADRKCARWEEGCIEDEPVVGNGTTRIWDGGIGTEIAVLTGYRLWFSRNGERALTVSGDGTARVWDVESGRQIADLKGHTKGVLSSAFSSDGKLLVTWSQDDVGRIWNAESGAEIAVLESGPSGLADTKFSFSGDGKRVTASFGSTIYIWEVVNGKKIAALRSHADTVWSSVFSADGKRVVTASDDGTARVWNAESGQEIVLRGHSHRVYGAAFSRDSKRVVTRSADATARIWDAETGREIAALRGHLWSVNSAEFTHDGERVVTHSDDKSTRIWDAASGAQIAVLHGYPLRLSPNSERLAMGSDTGARVWDVTWATIVRGESLRERVCGEKLVDVAQEFTHEELDNDPILRGIDKDDPIARNPCLRRGPLSLDYWTRLPGQLWRSTRWLVGVN